MIKIRGKSCLFFTLVAALTMVASTATSQTPTGQKSSPSWVEVKPTVVKVFASPKGKAQKKQTRTVSVSPVRPKNTVTRPKPTAARPKGARNNLAEQQRQLAMRLNRKQTQTYQRLITMIISPCCWTQPVSLHSSKLSDAIKIDVQRRLLSGANEKQIIAAYRKRFGDRVLSIPEKKYIFLIPLFASLLALLFVGVLILRWTQHSNAAPSLPSSDDSTEHPENRPNQNQDGNTPDANPENNEANPEANENQDAVDDDSASTSHDQA